MRRIYGRKCSLSLILDGGTSVSIPYCEETVREAVNGYFLPPALTNKTKSKFVVSGTRITGCFITRLDADCVLPLFNVISFPKKRFGLFQDHINTRKQYENVYCTNYSLYAENGKAFYLKCEVEGDRQSKVFYTENNHSEWSKKDTFLFDGKTVIINEKEAPLIYRIELKGSLKSNGGYELKIYSPLSTEFIPNLSNLEKISILLDYKQDVYIELHQLIPSHDLCDINCADTILAMRRFFISGKICVKFRNEDGMKELVL
ncbi:MAG: hypothetical protein SPJ89_01970 [Treponema sp.]|nr:hypothetical protein [Treponema sp.]